MMRLWIFGLMWVLAFPLKAAEKPKRGVPSQWRFSEIRC
jgi:hypothetical protein